MSRCTEELIWLNEREEEEISFDWSEGNTNMAAKREAYNVSEGDERARKGPPPDASCLTFWFCFQEMRMELAEKQDVMRSIQETASRLCQENHPAKQTVEVSRSLWSD